MATNDSTPSERAQILLKMLVERYIADGQPVGSRALAKFSGLDLSPASIRNIMADLEELSFEDFLELEDTADPPVRRFRVLYQAKSV